jgi:NAD-dependent deacetylase sirtuin 2
MGQENTKSVGSAGLSSAVDDAPRHLTLEDVAARIKSGEYKNVIVMVGAGISVSAGIPDFRTPGTGLYDNLEKFQLPKPESIFTMSYFREHPQAFFTLAKDLYPGKYKPTKTHHFIKFLADKHALLRCYTQNIDGLEVLAGLDPKLLVQAHGSFDACYCIDCKQEQNPELFKASCLRGEIHRCMACNGLVKPSIVFFEEPLSSEFLHCATRDFPKCDCLIVMGTSLQVMPFAALVSNVRDSTVRVLINRELTGNFTRSRFQDVFVQSDSDDASERLRALIDH